MDEGKELNINRLKYNEVNFKGTFEGPPNYSKHILSTFSCFDDYQM